MRRRGFLALTLGTTVVSGCSALSALDSSPEPVVLDYVRGDVVVTETSRVFELGGAERIQVVVRNDGIDAEVGLALFWVPRVGLDPDGKSRDRLRELGYELAAERVIAIPSNGERVVTFEAAMPADAAGYYVRKNNRTFGAVIENRGDAGPVTAQLVDTSDMSDQEVLATKTVDMDAGERRTVTFTVQERYEWFRVDIVAGTTAG